MEYQGSDSPPSGSEVPPINYAPFDGLNDDFSNFNKLYPPEAAAGSSYPQELPSDSLCDLLTLSSSSVIQPHRLNNEFWLSNSSTYQSLETFKANGGTSVETQNLLSSHVTPVLPPDAELNLAKQETRKSGSKTLIARDLPHRTPSLKSKGKSYFMKYSCPIFDYETHNKIPRTCNGCTADNLAQLRTHLTRPGRGQQIHCSFLKPCPICKDDFLDEEEFNQHCQNCNSNRPQRRRAAADAYYPVFCTKILASKNMVLAIRSTESFKDSVLQVNHDRGVTMDVQSVPAEVSSEGPIVPGQPPTFERSSTSTPTPIQHAPPLRQLQPRHMRTQPDASLGSTSGSHDPDEMNDTILCVEDDRATFEGTMETEERAELELQQSGQQMHTLGHVEPDPVSFGRSGPVVSLPVPWRFRQMIRDADLDDNEQYAVPWSPLSRPTMDCSVTSLDTKLDSSTVSGLSDTFPTARSSLSCLGIENTPISSYSNILHGKEFETYDRHTVDTSHRIRLSSAVPVVLTHYSTLNRQHEHAGSGTEDITLPSYLSSHSEVLGDAPVHDTLQSSRDGAFLYGGLLDVDSLTASSRCSSPLSICDEGEPEILSCPHSGCPSTFTGAYRRGNLQRHVRMKHGLVERTYPCGQGRCRRSFYRQDALLKHRRKHHPELDLPSPMTRPREPRDIHGSKLTTLPSQST